jgi:putative hydrolase of HD superfamily
MDTKLTGKKSNDIECAKQAHDYLMELGSLTVRLAGVDRAPRYPNGDRENDLEHSFHLALSAAELAANYFPKLDTGLVSQFSLVHDLPEVYTGDVWTFDISDEDRKNKELAEKEALKRLVKELPPHTAQLLTRYEKQLEPEARFVRLVDKFMPDIIKIMAGDADTSKKDLGIKSAEDLSTICEARSAKLQAMFPEFPFVHIIRKLVSKTFQEDMFK